MSDQLLAQAIALHDRFTHEHLDRRAFMAALTRLAGGSAAASLLLSSIAANAQAPPRVAADDPLLWTGTNQLSQGPNGLSGYWAHLRAGPGRNRQRPYVIVVHENRGLNDHIRDVARRLALAGYRAVAPDFLSLGGGGTPADEDAARTAIGALDLPRAVAAGVNLIAQLRMPERVVRPFETRSNSVGVVGFCWGGAMVNRLAVAAGEALGAGVSFYGPAPDPAEAARVRAALLILLAGLDERVNATALPWVAALRAAGRTVESATYPGVNHAFHNDTSTQRYNAEAAAAAWAATLAFFAQHLRA
jgi:carboxymethylenebutenolidase